MMEVLKQRILSEGRAVGKEVLLVDSFINHQVDPQLMAQIGDEFARIFRGVEAPRVATIETSGIAPAMMTALALKVPLVIMKKSVSAILSEELLQTPVHSFTKGSNYLLTVKRRFIQPQDRVLFIDDFLANGEAALGAAKLIAMAGAQVAGMGCVIEKAFQPGRARLQGEGYNPVALASIAWMEDGTIQFTEE